MLLPRECSGVEVALVEGDAAFLYDAGDDAGFGGAGADGADAAAALCDAVDFLTHFTRREEGIAAAIHGRAARMRGLTVERDGVALHAEGPQDGSERQIEIQEHRPLSREKRFRAIRLIERAVQE